MCRRIEFTSCTLPTYGRFLDPHDFILQDILSINTSQSIVEIFLEAIEIPKYLNVIFPFSYQSAHKDLLLPYVPYSLKICLILLHLYLIQMTMKNLQSS
uniref:Putative ovule protein n=1 Tax=Solanum chacoense TaxID=4108 RepID=A0A0V0GNI1_SOLCH